MENGKLARLRGAWCRDARPIAISAAVASLVTATPSVAAIVANADKVDGKHAVGSGATVDVRAGKLVATNKKGRLPNNIVVKAPNAGKVDGLDAADLQVLADGGTADTNPIVNGCGEAVAFSYPVTLTEPVQVFATAWSDLSVTSSTLRPAIRIELLDGQKIVAESNTDSWSGKDGDNLDVSELLFDVDGSSPYVAAPGSYTLRVHAHNSGACDDSTFAQYQSVRLTHLLLPVTG